MWQELSLRTPDPLSAFRGGSGKETTPGSQKHCPGNLGARAVLLQWEDRGTLWKRGISPLLIYAPLAHWLSNQYNPKILAHPKDMEDEVIPDTIPVSVLSSSTTFSDLQGRIYISVYWCLCFSFSSLVSECASQLTLLLPVSLGRQVLCQMPPPLQ